MKRFFLVLFLLIHYVNHAQMHQRQYHFYENEFVLNPAYASVERSIHTSVGSRFSVNSDDNQLHSSYVSITSIIDNLGANPLQYYNKELMQRSVWHGVGFYAYRDYHNFIVSKSVNASYSFNMGLPIQGVRLSTAARIGLQRQFISYPDDMLFIGFPPVTTEKYNALDLDLGGLIYHKNFSIGFGVENLHKGNVYELDHTTDQSLNRNAYLTAALQLYFFRKKLEWKPTYLFYSTPTLSNSQHQFSNQLKWRIKHSFFDAVSGRITFGDHLDYLLSFGTSFRHQWEINYQYSQFFSFYSSIHGVSISYKIPHKIPPKPQAPHGISF